MQRWLLGTAAALAMAAPAIAADLRPSAPPIVKAPPAPIGYNWTGCYVKGGGGYGLYNSELVLDRRRLEFKRHQRWTGLVRNRRRRL